MLYAPMGPLNGFERESEKEREKRESQHEMKMFMIKGNVHRKLIGKQSRGRNGHPVWLS